MSALDRALDVLAAAPATDASYEPYGTDDPSKCWRCLGPAGTGSSGVCDACREVLLGDGPIEPAPVGLFEAAWHAMADSAGFEFEYRREGSFHSAPRCDVRLGDGVTVHLPAGSVRAGDRLEFNIGGSVRAGGAIFIVHVNDDGTFQLRPAPIPEAVETFGHGGGRFRNATRASRRRRSRR